ncbi:hypothetical protein [Clostridium sp.]|uniref:hypothetical protein n=1 Tax=Clostridium sp. TaxID=1506 RepID=UPI003F39736B
MKNWLYIIGGFLIVGIIATFAIQLLIWALPIILALYIFFKLKNWFSSKKAKTPSGGYTNYTSVNSKEDISTEDVGEVIDVDFEDVNNR